MPFPKTLKGWTLHWSSRYLNSAEKGCTAIFRQLLGTPLVAAAAASVASQQKKRSSSLKPIFIRKKDHPLASAQVRRSSDWLSNLSLSLSLPPVLLFPWNYPFISLLSGQKGKKPGSFFVIPQTSSLNTHTHTLIPFLVKNWAELSFHRGRRKDKTAAAAAVDSANEMSARIHSFYVFTNKPASQSPPARTLLTDSLTGSIFLSPHF